MSLEHDLPAVRLPSLDASPDTITAPVLELVLSTNSITCCGNEPTSSRRKGAPSDPLLESTDIDASADKEDEEEEREEEDDNVGERRFGDPLITPE